jgi:hypothetical protein
MPSYFAPSSNYYVDLPDTTKYLSDVASKTRRQAFGGNYPIVWPDGACGLATVNANGNTRTSTTIQTTYPNGEYGYWWKDSTGGWILQYTTGDSLTSGAARTQLNAWPINPGLWQFDMQYRFGDLQIPWELQANGNSPTLIWQLKPSDGNPCWNLTTDTDTSDPTKINLVLYRRTVISGSATASATVSGLNPTSVLSTRIVSKLSYYSDGWVKWYVNGSLVYDETGITTLATNTTSYHQPVAAVYMYNNTNPATAPTRRLYIQKFEVSNMVNPERTVPTTARTRVSRAI